MNRWVIERAAPQHVPQLLALLQESGLPTADLPTAKPALWVARAADGAVPDIAGVIGLETFGDTGLLRSLAVRAAARGTGLGRDLVAHVESQARSTGLTQLVLLTTTAADFFAKHTYRVTSRADLPARVRASSEFRDVCPASATAMIKSLEAH
jgi:amino-acid N-acetyltransferase